MTGSVTLARRLLSGDAALAAQLAASLMIPDRANFVERPWGGTAMRRFKRLDDALAGRVAGAPIGEAFEIAAYDADDEARKYPSRLRLADGSELTLQQLLAAHPVTILGERFAGRFGPCFPLLPKTLNIRELLSVQAHPQGNTELYIIIEAEPGATIRLGFNTDIDGPRLRAELGRALQQQHALLARLPDCDAARLHQWLKPWLAERGTGVAAIEPQIRGALADSSAWPDVAQLLQALRAVYWRVLDSLNVIPVAAGQVIHNATPARAARAGRPPAAEVHALGNPEGREILALEIRRPGPTFRAWDNVRFPIREVDVDAAIAALNLSRTTPEDFRAEPRAVPGRPGTLLSVDAESFRVEHLRPSARLSVAVPGEPPHSLHVLRGSVTVTAGGDRVVGILGRGDSALVPAGVGRYTVSADADAEVVKASVPFR